MIEEFLPVPQVGHRYATKDKRLFTVKSVVDADGIILVQASDLNDKQFEFNFSQWNELDLSDIIQMNAHFSSKHEEEDYYRKTIDDINQRRSEGKVLKWKCGIINEFLWTCAGVDKDLLRTCKNDWASKAGLGSNVFFTALLTAMSMGFAIHMIIDNDFFVITIGILFGLLFFSLDRYIINTMHSDGTSSVSFREILSGLPRIIISVFLGLIIAVPMEILVFRGEINKFLNEENKKAILISSDILSTERRIDLNLIEIAKIDSCIRLYEKEYLAEVHSTTGPGIGQVAELMEEKINTSKARKDYMTYVTDSLMQVKERLVLQSSNSTDVEDSLLHNIHALYSVTSFYDRYGNVNMLFYLRLFISLFVITLLIIPIITKMMMANGIYDVLLTKEKEMTERIYTIRESSKMELNYNK